MTSCRLYGSIGAVEGAMLFTGAVRVNLSAGAQPLPAAWLRRIRAGDRLKFMDARNARRFLNVVEVGVDGVWAEIDKTSYIVPG